MNREQNFSKRKNPKFAFFSKGKFNSKNYILLSLFTYCLNIHICANLTCIPNQMNTKTI